MHVELCHFSVPVRMIFFPWSLDIVNYTDEFLYIEPVPLPLDYKLHRDRQCCTWAGSHWLVRTINKEFWQSVVKPLVDGGSIHTIEICKYYQSGFAISCFSGYLILHTQPSPKLMTKQHLFWLEICHVTGASGHQCLCPPVSTGQDET